MMLPWRADQNTELAKPEFVRSSAVSQNTGVTTSTFSGGRFTMGWQNGSAQYKDVQ